MELQCTNCGGDVPIEEESEFVQCSFCKAALYVGADETVKHVYLEFLLKEQDCIPYLKQRLTEMEIRDEIEVVRCEKQYYPYWCFEASSLPRTMVSAAPNEIDELSRRDSPPGKFRVFRMETADRISFMEPKKNLDQALVEFLGDNDKEKLGDIKVNLVEVPFFRLEYKNQGMTFQAVIDGITGLVYGGEWPHSSQRKKDMVLGGIALGTCFVFLLEAALIPSVWVTFFAYGVTGTIAYSMTRRALARMGW